MADHYARIEADAKVVGMLTRKQAEDKVNDNNATV